MEDPGRYWEPDKTVDDLLAQGLEGCGLDLQQFLNGPKHMPYNIEASVRRRFARIVNALAKQDEDDLRPLDRMYLPGQPFRPGPPPNFPKTKGKLKRLPGKKVRALFGEYDQQVPNENVARRPGRALAQYIGVGGLNQGHLVLRTCVATTS